MICKQLQNVSDAQLDGIARIERASFSSPWSRAEIEKTLRSSFARTFCVTVGASADAEAVQRTEADCASDPDAEHIVAFCIAVFLPGEAEILNIAVDPAFRRRGIGKELLRRVTEAARKSGAERICLEVRASNAAAQALYASVGFAVDGIRRGYYSAPKEDAVLMSMRLLQ